MIDKEDWKIVQKIQRVVFELRSIHSEIGEAMYYFEKKNPEAYKVIVKIAKIENSLAGQAAEKFPPLMEKLKKSLIKK